MHFDWRNYLELASWLTDQKVFFHDAEACYRTAVSRAYYAALGVVHGYIQETDNVPPFRTDTHRKIREHLKNSGHKVKKTIANQLEAFHINRIRVDYQQYLHENPLKTARKSIALSKKIIEEIETLHKETSRR